MKLNHGLSFRLLSALFIAFTLVVFLFQLPAYLVFYPRYQEFILRNFYQTVSQKTAGKLDSFMSERFNVLKFAYQKNEIKKIMNNPYAPNVKEMLEDTGMIAKYYSGNSLLVVQRTKQIFIDGQYGGTLNPKNQSDQWYFRLQATNYQYVIFTDWHQILKYPYVWLLNIIRTPDTELGVIGFGIEISELLDYLRPEDDDLNSTAAGEDPFQIMLVDSDGKIKVKKGMLFYDGENFFDDLDPLSVGDWKNWDNIHQVHKKDGTVYYYSALPLMSTKDTPSPWYLICGVSDQVLYGGTRWRVLIYFVGILFLYIGFVIYASVIISKMVIKRLSLLSFAVEAIAQNKLDTRLPDGSADEIGRLTGNISKIKDNITEYHDHLNDVIRARTEELQFALTKLEQKEELARHEILFAASIQQGLIPPPITWGDLSVSSYIRQMEQIGGDIIDVMDTEEQLVTYLADISGHGIPASMISMLTKIAFLYAIQNEENIIEIAKEVNQKIHFLINRQEIKYINYFTAFILLFRKDFSFDYISAGHIPAILFRKATKTCHLISSSSSMIGVFDTQIVKFNYKTDSLERGDKILVFSDGFINTKNPSGKKYGMEHLIEFTKEWSGVSAEEFRQLVIDDYEHHRKDRPIDDDVSLLIIERKM